MQPSIRFISRQRKFNKIFRMYPSKLNLYRWKYYGFWHLTADGR